MAKVLHFIYKPVTPFHYPQIMWWHGTSSISTPEETTVGCPCSKDGWFMYPPNSNGRMSQRKACGKA